mgnify:CR=1 FL=1
MLSALVPDSDCMSGMVSSLSKVFPSMTVSASTGLAALCELRQAVSHAGDQKLAALLEFSRACGGAARRDLQSKLEEEKVELADSAGIRVCHAIIWLQTVEEAAGSNLNSLARPCGESRSPALAASQHKQLLPDFCEAGLCPKMTLFEHSRVLL